MYCKILMTYIKKKIMRISRFMSKEMGYMIIGNGFALFLVNICQ